MNDQGAASQPLLRLERDNRKRLTNTPCEGAGPVLNWQDERRTEGSPAWAPNTSRSPAVSVGVPSSGMRRNEFCRSRGLSLSTLARHLKKRRWKRKRKNSRAECKLLGVELAAEKSAEESKSTTGLALVLSGGCRIEVQRDVDLLTFERFRGRTGRDGMCTP
jgi:hypothetical protein